jgi:hypothetical protein
MSRRRVSPYSPDYCSRETLAQRLELTPDYVDQLVRRGLLPPPKTIGEAKRFRWADVDRIIVRLELGDESHGDANDPYVAGIEHGTTEEASH